ncbi:MAG: prolyl oligopeptidase family serine peptidase [Pseudomonadota bacterium]
MRMPSILAGRLLAWALLIGLMPTLQAREGVLKFRERDIDALSILSTHPFDGARWTASLRHGKVLALGYFGDVQHAAVIELPPQRGAVLSTADAKPVGQHDWLSSLTHNWQIRDSDGAYFLRADSQHNEQFNIFSIDPNSGAVTQRTFAHSVIAFSLNTTGTKIAYVERLGPEGAPTRLRLLEMVSGEDRILLEDNQHHPFSWGYISWQPGEQGLVLTCLVNGERRRGNLTYVPLDNPGEARLLLDQNIRRTFPRALGSWVSASEVLAVSGEGTARNAYRLNVESGAWIPVTDLKSNLSFAQVINNNGGWSLLALASDPLGTRGYLYELDGSFNKRQLFSVREFLAVLDVYDNRLLVRHSNPQLPFAISEMTLTDQAPQLVPRVVMPPGSRERYRQCRSRAVTFDTFDDIRLEIGGKSLRGQLHGFLYEPLKPPTEARHRVALVQAFYGGDNRFNFNYQIYCAAGISVFSPAPRGTPYLSSAFERANDGDFGGAEITDVAYASDALRRLSSMAVGQIGLFGHSHGGYATLRALTANLGQPRWGFGISNSGFSDIYEQYSHSNIKQWIVKEAGDPQDPQVLARWRARSPRFHLDRLKVPVLLVHGDRDRRVPYSQSKLLFELLRGHGKRAELLTLEGAGHGYTRTRDRLRALQATLDFIDRHASPTGS